MVSTVKMSRMARRWLALWLVFVVSLAATPEVVWCYESDGRIQAEYVCTCVGAPVSDPASHRATSYIGSNQSCDSCFDVPIFVAESTLDSFSSVGGPIPDEGGSASAPYSLVEIALLQPWRATTLDSYPKFPSHDLILSTVLLI